MTKELISLNLYLLASSLRTRSLAGANCPAFGATGFLMDAPLLPASFLNYFILVAHF